MWGSGPRPRQPQFPGGTVTFTFQPLRARCSEDSRHLRDAGAREREATQTERGAAGGRSGQTVQVPSCLGNMSQEMRVSVQTVAEIIKHWSYREASADGPTSNLHVQNPEEPDAELL
ncbi:unnamed protein product [Pleuronectes platessa]|uniref:Uncharacterized protein n=1 Tax=Pleuronectes platessa TaxID=8262 RepID=A0A9N7UUK1_PLEPL|nr:unnamed protein product [Pleuronectes platessa]